MKKAIQLDDGDNVATVTDDMSEGEQVEVLSPRGEVVLDVRPVEDVMFGHKLALRKLGRGEEIVKYGEVIGVASKRIMVGEWVHTHNTESGRLPTGGREAKR